MKPEAVLMGGPDDGHVEPLFTHPQGFFWGVEYMGGKRRPQRAESYLFSYREGDRYYCVHSSLVTVER